MTTRYKFAAMLGLMIAIALQARAMAGSEAITSAEVASAITAAGVQVSAKQVILLSDVAAKSTDPALQVESVAPWGANRLKVRLHCVRQEECLPFYVAVGLRQEQRTSVAPSLPASPARPERPAEEEKQVTIRAGAPAVLFLDGAHIHIQMAVTCLEGGAVGQSIRVVDKGRHVYQAEICNDGYLRGRL